MGLDTVYRLMKRRRKSHASTAKARIDKVFDKLKLEEVKSNPRLAIEIGMKRRGYYEVYKMYGTHEVTAEAAVLEEKMSIVLKLTLQVIAQHDLNGFLLVRLLQIMLI